MGIAFLPKKRFFRFSLCNARAASALLEQVSILKVEIRDDLKIEKIFWQRKTIFGPFEIPKRTTYLTKSSKSKSKQSEILTDFSGQYYKDSMIVNCNSRVEPDLKLPHIMTLEP